LEERLSAVTISERNLLLKWKKTNLPFGLPAYLLVSLLVIIIYTGGWLIWSNVVVPSPRFDFVLINVDREPRKILPGETIHLHPNDRVKILKISTNILFNRGVRLVAEGFDVNALRYEEMNLFALLPDRKKFEHYSFEIRIKRRNEDLGFMDWEIRPFAEDWLDKADRTIRSNQRLAVLEDALRHLPEDTRIRRRLLDEFKSQKLWKQAAQMLEDMAGEKPDRNVLIELLDVYTAMKNSSRIISVLKRAIKLDPDDLGLRLRLAEVLEDKGKKDAAVEEYEALLKRSSKGDSIPIYKRLGYLYAEMGQSEKAISFYLKAADLDERDANLYYNLSDLYEKTGKTDQSNLFLGKAVRLKTDDVEGRLKLAQRLIEKGELKDAEKYLSEVQKTKPDSIESLLLMARLVERQGEKQKLKKIYEKILSMDPKNDTVIYNLGALEYEAGNLDESLHYFKKYVKLHPKDTGVHGTIFDIFKKQKNALEAFKQAQILVELDPKDIDAYRYIFDYLKGDYDEIIRVMEKGLKANPNQKDLIEYLVTAYLKTGRDDLAVKQIEDRLKVEQGNIGLLIHLARLREKMGDPAAALEVYKKIIDLSPGNEEAEDAYLRLRLRGVLKGEQKK
jgi:tetratricopeptide (TPR) repeat protein